MTKIPEIMKQTKAQGKAGENYKLFFPLVLPHFQNQMGKLFYLSKVVSFQ
jgi:hypothetical protein